MARVRKGDEMEKTVERKTEEVIEIKIKAIRKEMEDLERREENKRGSDETYTRGEPWPQEQDVGRRNMERPEELKNRGEKRGRSKNEADGGKYRRKRTNKMQKRAKRRKNREREDDCFKIAYNNVQGKEWNSRAKIEKLIKENKWNMICLTETHSKEWGKELTQIEGFKKKSVNRHASQGKGGGITVWSKLGSNTYWTEEEGEDEQMNSERIWTTVEGEQKMAVCTVYMRPEGGKNETKNEELKVRIVEEIKLYTELGYGIVIIGDLNGHIGKKEGGQQGIHETNKNGKRVLEIMERGKLKMINWSRKCEGKWTWMKRGQKSVVDYVMMDERTASRVKKMTIDETGEKWSINSDHNFIEVQLKISKEIKDVVKEPQWNINERTDWKQYRERIEERLQKWDREAKRIGEGEGIVQLAYEKLMRTIIETGEEVIGKKVKRGKRDRKTTWTQKRRNKAGVAWRKANKMDETDVMNKWKRFQQLSQRVKRERIGAENRRARQMTIKAMEDGRMGSKIWRKIRGSNYKEKKEIDILDIRGEVVTDKTEIKKKTEEYITKLGKPQESIEEQHGGGQRQNQINLINTIERKEMKEAITKLKRERAIGLDNIPNEFIIEGGEKLWESLRHIFNLICEKQEVPESWGEERIKLLYKGKSRLCLDNYRSIAITSNIGKVFTRILGKRLASEVEEKKWLGEDQNGFRKGRGGMDNILTLTTVMELARKQGKKLFLGFIDLRKAYDRVDRNKLWESLEDIGIGEKSITVMKQLYSNHRRKANTVGGWTKWIDCQVGVKQGCVLSPMLFAIFIRDMLEKAKQVGGWKIDQDNLAGLLFADDVVLIATSEKELKDQLQEIQTFVREKRLEINLEKSQIMKLSRGGGDAEQWEVVDAQGQVIGKMSETTVYKYLGIKLGTAKIFTHQRSRSIRSILAMVGIMKARCRCLSRDVDAMEKMWLQVIKPKLMYGKEVIVYDKQWIGKLESAQHKAGCHILKVRSKAPCMGVRGELGWKSIEGEIMHAKLIFCRRIFWMPQSRWVQRILIQADKLGIKTDWWKKVEEAENRFEISHKDYLQKNWKKIVRSKWRRWEEIEWRRKCKESWALRYYNKEALGERAWQVMGRILEG